LTLQDLHPRWLLDARLEERYLRVLDPPPAERRRERPQNKAFVVPRELIPVPSRNVAQEARQEQAELLEGINMLVVAVEVLEVAGQVVEELVEEVEELLAALLLSLLLPAVTSLEAVWHPVFGVISLNGSWRRSRRSSPASLTSRRTSLTSLPA
jgi:hypothetical protein